MERAVHPNGENVWRSIVNSTPVCMRSDGHLMDDRFRSGLVSMTGRRDIRTSSAFRPRSRWSPVFVLRPFRQVLVQYYYQNLYRVL